MSEHYHDENDVKLMREMRKLAPDDFNAWLGLNSIVGRENGAIPRKYRELIAIAVSGTTQCPYCIDAYTQASLEKGSNVEEMTEAVHVAAAIRGGASFSSTSTLTLGLALQPSVLQTLRNPQAMRGQGIFGRHLVGVAATPRRAPH